MRRSHFRCSQAAKMVTRRFVFPNGLSLLLTAFMLLVALPCHAAEATVLPSAKWAEATPESQSVDSAKLNEAAELLARTLGADGARELVVIRHGRMIWKGDNVDKRHGVWSATKSFTSTVPGLLIADGKCTLDTRVADVLPELKPHYPDVTLRHFTTMTSGFRAVGRVLDTADELGPRERTLVAFISDNGAFMLPGRGLEVQSNAPWRGMREGDYKLLRFSDGGPWQLFDLSQDVGEQTDLAASRPEKLKELVQHFDQWRAGIAADSSRGVSLRQR